MVNPQWQGWGASAAVSAGTHSLAQFLDREPDHLVAVPDFHSLHETDGVLGLSELVEQSRDVVETLQRHRAERLLYLAGDCGAELAPIAWFNASHADLSVVWIDAHADLNTPETSPSGSFHGMVLRRLIDEGLPAGNVVLAGTRDIDPGERATIAAWALPVVGAAEVVERLEAIGPRDVWLHLDVDVIDPSEFGSVGFPVAGGLRVGEVLDLIGAIAARWPFAGAAVTEFSPAPAADDTDLESLVRIVEALRSH